MENAHRVVNVCLGRSMRNRARDESDRSFGEPVGGSPPGCFRRGYIGARSVDVTSKWSARRPVEPCGRRREGGQYDVGRFHEGQTVQRVQRDSTHL